MTVPSHTSSILTRFLGPIVSLPTESNVGSLQTLPEYIIPYPPVVVAALGELYDEYNRAFSPLVYANREWDTDYQYCSFGVGGRSINFGVQVDMLGLTEEFLEEVSRLNVAEVRERLRGMIFELENSLAMYQITERLCSQGSGGTNLRTRWRSALADLRRRFGKPIALLAVTDQKYFAMCESEFGKLDGQSVSDGEVQRLSGFDRFFSPTSFREHVVENNGRCDYLLFVRSSDPVDKLKKPETVIEQPLLGDSELRRIIKANAITFNIDAPDMDPSCRINDTKDYMSSMGMAFDILEESDLFSPAFQRHLVAGKLYHDFADGSRLSSSFTRYLLDRGVAPVAVELGTVHLRAKPSKGAYGCYGHVTGPLSAAKEFRAELRRNMRQRGRYVIQPELETPCIVNATDEAAYTFIDRNFLTFTNGRPVFLGGVRMLLPTESLEAKRKRIHGNNSTVFAEIISDVR